jgi:DNA-binding SARP family transcriptional activator
MSSLRSEPSGTGYLPRWPVTGDGVPPGAAAAGSLAEPAGDNSVTHDRLRVQVLGPVVIAGAAREPQPKQVELVVALALHPSPGLTGSALATMLGRDPDHPKPRDILRQLITRTRRRLGGPGDGRDYIRYQDGRYTLTSAWLDWAAFTALARRGSQASGRADLRAALSLVRGELFGGVYFWWLEETPTMLDSMRAAVTDTAALLAQLELSAGDPAASAWAARAGLAADPFSEPLWRAVMTAEAAAGNTAGMHRAWQRLCSAIADITPGGLPHPDTVALYQDLTRERVTERR